MNINASPHLLVVHLSNPNGVGIIMFYKVKKRKKRKKKSKIFNPYFTLENFENLKTVLISYIHVSQRFLLTFMHITLMTRM